MDDESLLHKLDTDLSTGRAGVDMNRGILHREKQKPVPDDWIDVPEPDMPDPVEQKRATQKSFFKKMFIGACVFATVAAGAFVVSLFTGRARLSGENIDMKVSAQSFADSGEEVNVQVAITNNNTVPMELATLTFSYPLGSTRDPNAAKKIDRDIGTVAPGETRTETFAIQLFGEQGTEKNLSATVEYRLQGSNAIFDKSSETKLALRSSIASLVMAAPETTLSGQEVPIEITVTGNSTMVINDATVVGEYPDGCSFVRSEPAPTLDKNIWYLGDLPAGDQRRLSVVLSCSGVENSEKNIIFTLGDQDGKNQRTLTSIYTSSAHLIKLSSAFLATTFVIGSRPVDASSSISQNRDTQIDINWKSNAETPITNASIKVVLSGTGYDPAKLRAGQGFFDSNSDTIVWTKNEVRQFATISPGDSGTLSFTITPKSGLTEPATINMALSVDAIGFGGSPQTLVNATTAQIPIVTDLQLIPKTLYHSGPFTNTGSMPMKVGKETTFTITWQLANSTNTVSDVVVKTTLPTGIVWKNAVAPASDASTLSYNTVTREIVWNAGSVPVGQNAKSISFQVGITPTTGQLGTVPNLTTDVAMTGTDTITRTIITQTKRPLNTRLTGDTSNIGVDGKVK